MRHKRLQKAVFIFLLGVLIFNFPFIEIVNKPLSESSDGLGLLVNSLMGIFLLWGLYIFLLYQFSKRN